MQQADHRWATRAGLLLLTLLGLLGMHGLPDVIASASGATTMQAASMSPHLSFSPMRTIETPSDGHTQSAGMLVVVNRSGQLRPESRFPGPGRAAPMGCGMEHAGCVAVLRDSGHLTGDGPACTVVTALDRPALPLVPTPDRGPRAPPDVSLIELGISRT